ncbi:hypothetical protein BGY98DRAFT_86939 [Russula aff. rugulosa BPL654]|nr:hypothetical protein BGY98DRAFT_86939 [Russula aff. rugulosa BPL654]
MPSYMTLTVLALAASTISPALSAPVPVRVTREQALTHPDLASGKRGLFNFFGPKIGEDVAAKVGGGAAAKVGEDASAKVGGDAAKAAAGKTWGQRIKSMALNLVVGGIGAIIGTDVYQKFNPHSMALGETAGSPSTSGNTSSPTTGASGSTSYSTTSASGTTGYATSTGQSYTNTGSPGTSYANTGYNSASTDPSTGGTGGAGIFTRSNSNLNSRTSPHKNLLSRTDLEKAIGLFTRMLDELD